MSTREPAGHESGLPARVWPALLLFGFSSGLPQPLVDGTLSTWLSKAGYSTAELLRIGYVTLPFSLKVLWAPLVDRYVPPLLGRRRGWILASQLALMVGLFALSRLDPRADFALLALVATIVAFAGATQDLVVQGYTCDALPDERLAAGAGLSVWGYRCAWLISGGLVLSVAGDERFGWSGAYAAMALLLGLGVLGTLLAPEPVRVAPPATLRATLVEPLVEWRRSLGARGAVFLILFALLYRLPDMVANLLAPPFLASLYDLSALGYTRGVIGLAGAAVGVALAGWAMPRLGTLRTLFVFGLAQAFSNLGYVGLVDGRWWSGTSGLVGVLFVENVCGALAATAFVAYLMSFCRSASAATQYALLTTVTLLGPHLLRGPIAEVSERLGWSGFFALTTALVLPALVLLWWMRPNEASPGSAALPKAGSMIRRILVIGALGVAVAGGARFVLAELTERRWERRKAELLEMAVFQPKERRPWEVRFESLVERVGSSPRMSEIIDSPYRPVVCLGDEAPRALDEFERVWVAALWNELTGLDPILAELRKLPIDALAWHGETAKLVTTREATVALCARAWMAAETGDSEGAGLAYADALRLARATDDGSTMGTLIRFTSEQTTLRSLRSVLDLGASPSALQATVAPLLMDWNYDARAAERMVRRDLTWLAEVEESGEEMFGPAVGLQRLAPIEGVLELAHGPIEAVVRLGEERVSGRIATTPRDDLRLHARPLSYLHARHSQRNVALTALAVAAYHERHGTFPGQLSDLEALAPELTLDPLTGSALPYSRSDSGAEVGPAAWGMRVDVWQDLAASPYVWTLR